ncbi:hypothetical protein DP067_02000 [Mycoplasmopsis anatis]|uniref:hypothetical protein n=1 Tax=Mycoplasmopsis anatis TaxID=171279 RepID=UPI000DC70EF8|nr:hypothetical protein [Mycoplasmopsis anatis]AWX70129.1 hypothetical protein DP067_02000 [Mycoplasmopsis anatis]VEU73429.1 Uncharacterised protein [Mycoplasmopsis anatis]
MLKGKMIRPFVLSLLSVIFSITGTLSFIPKIIQSGKTDFAIQAHKYGDMNMNVTVIIMILFAALALYYVLKALIKNKKDNVTVSKKDNILSILVIFLTVLAVITAIFSAISYKAFEPSLVYDLLQNGKPLVDSQLSVLTANNDKIKYIILSVVFVYFAFVAVLLILLIVLKKSKKEEVK